MNLNRGLLDGFKQSPLLTFSPLPDVIRCCQKRFLHCDGAHLGVEKDCCRFEGVRHAARDRISFGFSRSKVLGIESTEDRIIRASVRLRWGGEAYILEDLVLLLRG